MGPGSGALTKKKLLDKNIKILAVEKKINEQLKV